MEIITVNHIQHATEFEDGTSNSLVASVAIVRMIVDEKDVKVSIDVNNNSNHNQDNIYGAVIPARTQVAGQLSAGQLLIPQKYMQENLLSVYLIQQLC